MKKQPSHYNLLVNTDLTEGRGPLRVLATFSNYPAAQKVKLDPRFSQWEVMGYHDRSQRSLDTYIKKVDPQPVFNTAEEFWEYIIKQEKKAALAKLSLYERQLLGIKEE